MVETLRIFHIGLIVFNDGRLKTDFFVTKSLERNFTEVSRLQRNIELRPIKLSVSNN